MKAIDYSAFSAGGPVPVATFRKIRSLFPSGDMLLNIPGAWHGLSGYTGAWQSIRNAREAGFTHHATYVAINSMAGRESVEQAQAYIGNEWENLAFIGIDVELPTTPTIVHDACVAAMEMGVRPVIYTARWAWFKYMADTSLFNGRPLWNAFYDNDPDIDFAHYPYGGWELGKLAGEQYTGTMQVDGYGFDFNHFRDEFVTAGSPPAVPPLVALVDAWKRDMADLAVNAADLIHTPGDLFRLDLHTIFTERRAADWKALLAKAK